VHLLKRGQCYRASTFLGAILHLGKSPGREKSSGKSFCITAQIVFDIFKYYLEVL
jgi:hypothetical protein